MFENIKSTEDLKSAILTINVKDYGDFKRKVVLYLNRFREDNKLSSEHSVIINTMVEKLQFSPPLDIERARSWSIDQLSKF